MTEGGGCSITSGMMRGEMDALQISGITEEGLQRRRKRPGGVVTLLDCCNGSLRRRGRKIGREVFYHLSSLLNYFFQFFLCRSFGIIKPRVQCLF